ncbi:MAG: hypothetical protein NXI20_19700 [bacterium]|nr:hypothetical protein [bacterium]
MEKKNINNIVQEKLKTIEDKIVPGTNWDKATSWKKIREILDTKNKKMVIWYCAMAASISFAFAATLNENLNFVKHSIEEMLSKPIAENTTDQEILTEQETFQPIKKEAPAELSKKTMVELSDFSENTIKPVAEFTPYQNKLVTQTPRQKSSPKLSVSPSISVNANPNLWNDFSPTLGVDFKYQLNNDSKNRKYVSLGLQSTMFTKFENERSVKVYPATFVTTKYGQSKVNINGKKKIWEVGAGYLVNPDHEIFDDSTFKVQYNRTIIGRFRGGPELIFTDKFKKVYPGFTIVFS